MITSENLTNTNESIHNDNECVTSVPIDTKLITWIDYPKDNQGLEEYMQLLSTRLLVIEKEKQKLELERQNILQILWGNNHLISHIDNKSTNTVTSTSIPDKSELIPLSIRNRHVYTNTESLNGIIEPSNKNEENLFDELDFNKLDLDTLNLFLSYFGIKNISNDEFNKGVEMLLKIRNYLLDCNTTDIKSNNVSPIVTEIN